MISKNRTELMEEIDDLKLIKALTSGELYPQEEAEAITHALVDINNSLKVIYEQLVPQLIHSAEMEVNFRKELLWSIREEFRHIEYHLSDAKLCDL